MYIFIAGQQSEKWDGKRHKHLVLHSAENWRNWWLDFDCVHSSTTFTSASVRGCFSHRVPTDSHLASSLNALRVMPDHKKAIVLSQLFTQQLSSAVFRKLCQHALQARPCFMQSEIYKFWKKAEGVLLYDIHCMIVNCSKNGYIALIVKTI